MTNLTLLTALIFTVTSYTNFPITRPLSPASPIAVTTALYPPLHTKGPYLTYLKDEANHQSIVYTDPDGYGRKVVALPADIHLESLNALSPDGTHIAYYTGNDQSPYNLTLHVFNLSTAKTETFIRLLSDDYPNNFTKAADILSGGPFDTDPSSPITSDSLQSAFTQGIHAFSWSPSGRYLAFAGQMNGLSSNAYVLDLNTHAVQQLSDGPEEIASIGDWSADEQQINYFSTVFGPSMGDSGGSGHSYIAHLNGNSEPHIYHQHGFINNLSDYENAFVRSANMGSFDDLLVYSAATKTVDLIWKDCLFDYAADRQSRTILFAPMTGANDSDSGLVLYDRATGTYTPVAKFEGWTIQPWHTPTFRYLAENFNGQLLAVTANGKSQEIGHDQGIHNISPDNKWLVLYGNDRHSSLQFYTPDAKLAVELKDFSVDNIVWLDGSQAMFIKSGNVLMYLNTTDFKPVIVDKGLDDYFNYTWTTKAGN